MTELKTSTLATIPDTFKDFFHLAYLYALSKQPGLSQKDFLANTSFSTEDGKTINVKKWNFTFPIPTADNLKSFSDSDVERVKKATQFPATEVVLPSISSSDLLLVSPRVGSFIFNTTLNVPQLYINGKWWNMSPSAMV